MKIGIIGTGNMGRALGLLWAERGHDVLFGARTLEKAKKAAALSKGKAAYGTNAEAARHGDVLLYTARGIDPNVVTEQAGLYDDKIVIDCNNSDVPQDFVYPSIDSSLAELLQRDIPKAKVVKAFNTMAMEVFELCPKEIVPYKISNFVASDDPEARKIVMGLSTELGFDSIDCDKLVHARLLEGQADFIRFLLIKGIRPDGAFSIVDVPDVEAPRLGGREATSLGELK